MVHITIKLVIGYFTLSVLKSGVLKIRTFVILGNRNYLKIRTLAISSNRGLPKIPDWDDFCTYRTHHVIDITVLYKKYNAVQA